MASWEPVDIHRDGTGEEYDNWDDDVMNDLERRFDQLRQFNKTLDESREEDLICMKMTTKEFVAKIYGRITKLFNERRKKFRIKGGANIMEPIRDYGSFNMDENGNITFVRKNEVIGLGNIEDRLLSPSKMIAKLDVNRLKSIGFINITDEDIYPNRA